MTDLVVDLELTLTVEQVQRLATMAAELKMPLAQFTQEALFKGAYLLHVERLQCEKAS